MQIELRNFERADIERLLAWISSPEDLGLWAGGYFQYPVTNEQLSRYLESAADPFGRRRIFKAVEAKNGAVIGHVELSHIWPHLSGRLSRVLIGEPSLRGKGIGAQMVQCLVDWAFSEFSFDRIDVGVADSNKAAIGCYRKVGFEHVGTRPDALETSIGVINVYWMSVVSPGSPT